MTTVKVICPRCDGEKWIWNQKAGKWVICYYCNGAGYILSNDGKK